MNTDYGFGLIQISGHVWRHYIRNINVWRHYVRSIGIRERIARIRIGRKDNIKYILEIAVWDVQPSFAVRNADKQGFSAGNFSAMVITRPKHAGRYFQTAHRFVCIVEKTNYTRGRAV